MSSSNNAPPTSSPPPLSPPMVSTKKRVTQTYGSKRIEAPPSDETPDADRSFGTLVDGDISISLSPATRSSGIDVRVVSSQETKVDEDEDDEKDDSHEQTKHEWSWMSALKEPSEDEGGSTPALPLAHADGSPSPPASRSRGVKSRGKRPSTSPKKPQRLQLTTVSSDSRTSVTASAEPETGGSDSDRFPSPLKPKQRPSRRTAGTAMVEDSESEVPLASSSKSRGNVLGPVDADANDRAPLDSTKQKRKTTGRKPTAKARRREEEELKKNQARIAAERHVEFPVAKQPVTQYHISAFCNSFQAGISAAAQKPPNHSSEPEDIQQWSSPVKQMVPPSKRKSTPPPADIDDEIGLEILPPGAEESRPGNRLSLNRKQSPRKVRIPGQRPKDMGIYKRQVNQILLTRHNNQKSEIIQKKESAWKEKGGSTFKPLEDNRASLGEYIERIEHVDHQQQSGDESDEEYRPNQGHRSSGSGSPSDEDTENNPPPPFILNPENTVGSGDDTEEHDENVPPIRNPRAARTRVDDSGGEEGKANDSRVLVPSTSLLDVQEHDAKTPTPIRGGQDRQSLTPADGETDKENVDDNKENAAILSSSRSAFSAFMSPRVWKAPASPTPSLQPRLFERPAPDIRSPLSELRTEDKDEDAFGSPSRRRLSALPSSGFGPPPIPAPLFGPPVGSDDDDDLQPAPLMRKGFSQLFGTAPGRSLTFGESPNKPARGGFDAFRKGDDEFGLSLSPDAKLQPALEVSSTALKRADDIFQNEQEMILRAAQDSAKPKKPQLYIDENGFLTQSRPVGTNPQLYHPATQATPLTERKPLGTLVVAESPFTFSDADDPGSPSPFKPVRRLRRRGSDSSAPGGEVGGKSPSSSRPPKRNAFETLEVGAQKAKEKKPLKKSEFVEAEAQESDEDDGFGFKKRTTDDNEDDSDVNDDKAVEGLVDDAVMDETTLAEKLVQEKYKEHQEQDDAQLEKQAKDIVEGKKRAKRRGHELGSDESGSEDEDADRRRRKSIKKPRFDGGKLEGIDVDPTAFLKPYNSNLDDDEFLFLADEDSQMAERHDEDEDDDGEPRETVSTREIEAEVRRAAREKKQDDLNSFDPSDTGYMDRYSDDDEPSLRTRDVSKRAPKVTRMRGDVDAVCFQSCLDDSQRSQEQSWLKKLGSSTISGVYQGPSGGAVTAAGARAKGKSSRMVSKPSNPREERRKPVKEASMLVSALRKGKTC